MYVSRRRGALELSPAALLAAVDTLRDRFDYLVHVRTEARGGCRGISLRCVGQCGWRSARRCACVRARRDCSLQPKTPTQQPSSLSKPAPLDRVFERNRWDAHLTPRLCVRVAKEVGDAREGAQAINLGRAEVQAVVKVDVKLLLPLGVGGPRDGKNHRRRFAEHPSRDAGDGDDAAHETKREEASTVGVRPIDSEVVAIGSVSRWFLVVPLGFCDDLVVVGQEPCGGKALDFFRQTFGAARGLSDSATRRLFKMKTKKSWPPWRRRATGRSGRACAPGPKREPVPKRPGISQHPAWLSSSEMYISRRRGALELSPTALLAAVDTLRDQLDYLVHVGTEARGGVASLFKSKSGPTGASRAPLGPMG
ncbi:hypothetical protein GGX14DRAFT_540791 [Mycena pura]|uniref:Uncharacterized protein n=1 Tax=Mycena pura TaxID=153505 RepID=A0AAD6VRN8_9AGAR|nr:hypothetical protein GGX14DRAFT_540791 [Mycena pura]